MKNGIELMYVDNYKYYCYFILISFIVDYKEQVFITNIKANMQCLICYVLSKKKELVITCKSDKPTSLLKISLINNATTW